ncbi:hypothetical protein OAO87_02860 [bacterium]|nr:hypothetical protein [bacterium]
MSPRASPAKAPLAWCPRAPRLPRLPSPVRHGTCLTWQLREAVLVLEAAVQAQPLDTIAWQTLGQAHADADDDGRAIACLRRAVRRGLRRGGSAAAAAAACEWRRSRWLRSLLRPRRKLRRRASGAAAGGGRPAQPRCAAGARRLIHQRARPDARAYAPAAVVCAPPSNRGRPAACRGPLHPERRGPTRRRATPRRAAPRDAASPATRRPPTARWCAAAACGGGHRLESHPEFTDIGLASEAATGAAGSGAGVAARTAARTSPFELQQRVTDLFLRAVEKRPANADLHAVLGVLYNLSRSYPRAMGSFEAALRLRPEDYSLWNKLGATQVRGPRAPCQRACRPARAPAPRRRGVAASVERR